MATGTQDSDPSPDSVIVINTADGGPKSARPWYARNAYCIPAMYLAAIAALWLMAVVISPAVELPITGMLALILMVGPVGLVGLFLPLPMFGNTDPIITMATLSLMCAGNCFLLYRFGRFLDS